MGTIPFFFRKIIKFFNIYYNNCVDKSTQEIYNILNQTGRVRKRRGQKNGKKIYCI